MKTIRLLVTVGLLMGSYTIGMAQSNSVPTSKAEIEKKTETKQEARFKSDADKAAWILANPEQYEAEKAKSQYVRPIKTAPKSEVKKTVTSKVADVNLGTTQIKSVKSNKPVVKADGNAKVNAARAERKINTSKSVDINKQQKPVQMTDAYIDGKVSELNAAIMQNKDNKEFNLSGYENRIKYLESRRPKK